MHKPSILSTAAVVNTGSPWGILGEHTALLKVRIDIINYWQTPFLYLLLLTVQPNL